VDFYLALKETVIGIANFPVGNEIAVVDGDAPDAAFCSVSRSGRLLSPRTGTHTQIFPWLAAKMICQQSSLF
jgi:hypothetical protein